MCFTDIEGKIVNPWDYKQLEEIKKRKLSWKFIFYATIILEGTKILRKNSGNKSTLKEKDSILRNKEKPQQK